MWLTWRSIGQCGDASSCETQSFAVAPMGRKDLLKRSLCGTFTTVTEAEETGTSQRTGCRARSHFPGSVEKKIELPILYVARNHEELHRRDHQRS